MAKDLNTDRIGIKILNPEITIQIFLLYNTTMLQFVKHASTQYVIVVILCFPLTNHSDRLDRFTNHHAHSPGK